MIRRRAVVPAAVVAAVVVALAGCTSTPPPVGSSPPTPVATSASPSPSVTPTPTPTPTATTPKLPPVRWDRVPRGSLPEGCATFGGTKVFVRDGTVYAKGPSLSCDHASGGPYWVRAVVKVAELHGRGHWVYVTKVHPSEPARDGAGAQRTEHVDCPAGKTVRAVASFVLTAPDGHQIRYRRIGSSDSCS
jgi:hypothetical protein